MLFRNKLTQIERQCGTICEAVHVPIKSNERPSLNPASEMAPLKIWTSQQSKLAAIFSVPERNKNGSIYVTRVTYCFALNVYCAKWKFGVRILPEIWRVELQLCDTA